MGACSSKESTKPKRQSIPKANATSDPKNTKPRSSKPKPTKPETSSKKPIKNTEGRRLGSQQDKEIEKNSQLVGKKDFLVEQKESQINENNTEIRASSAVKTTNTTKTSPTGTTTSSHTDKNVARELAAKAAQERFDNLKKKNESGVLGRKLGQERKKTTKDFGLETGKEKLDDSNNDNLIYD